MGSASDRLFSFECVDYLGTNSHGSDVGGASSDIVAYDESYFAPTPDIVSIVISISRSWR